MVEIDRSVRLRAFAGEWFTIGVIVLLVLTAILGWWAYQVNAVPDIAEEERLVEQWSESTAYNHSADIINGSLPFAEGERVVNRPIYYFNLSKQLDGTYHYRYHAESGDVTVRTETMLLIRGGELVDQRMNSTFWTVARPLGSATSDALRPGQSHTVDFTVDIRNVLETITTVEQQLGASEGLVDVRVRSISAIEGTVEGDPVNATYESDMAMVVNPATFRVIEQFLVDERHQTFETVEVVQQPSPLAAYGSITLAGLAAMLLLGLIGSRLGGFTELSEEERELLKVERQRDQYAEWISTGTFPSERDYDETVLVDDLEGLIDIAIDSNKRVIEDTQLGVSTVLDDNYIYIYVRPDSPARDWLIEYADTTADEFDQYDF